MMTFEKAFKKLKQEYFTLLKKNNDNPLKKELPLFKGVPVVTFDPKLGFILVQDYIKMLKKRKEEVDYSKIYVFGSLPTKSSILLEQLQYLTLINKIPSHIMDKLKEFYKKDKLGSGEIISGVFKLFHKDKEVRDFCNELIEQNKDKAIDEVKGGLKQLYRVCVGEEVIEEPEASPMTTTLDMFLFWAKSMAQGGFI